jgi:hypothetical protein
VSTRPQRTSRTVFGDFLRHGYTHSTTVHVTRTTANTLVRLRAAMQRNMSPANSLHNHRRVYYDLVLYGRRSRSRMTESSLAMMMRPTHLRSLDSIHFTWLIVYSYTCL